MFLWRWYQEPERLCPGATPWLGNPCKGIEKNQEEARERYFSRSELERIVSALQAYPVSSPLTASD